MFSMNQYFDGKVASLAFNGADGKATLGVIAPGEYEFGTATIEIMTVISGEMEVQVVAKTIGKFTENLNRSVLKKTRALSLRYKKIHLTSVFTYSVLF